jgi:hypothetical protein
MIEHNELSADYLDLLRQDAGKGAISQDFSEQARPFLRIAQNNSPETNKRDVAYIDGCEPGDWLRKGSPNPVTSGVEGIKVIPLIMTPVWIEYLPDRQGFFDRHTQRPDDLVPVQSAPGSRRQRYERRSTHNLLEEAREFLLLIEGELCLFSCTSTQLQFARQWQSHFHHVRLPGHPDFIPPSYAHEYLLTTVAKSNVQGTWFASKFTDLGLVSLAVYKAARALAIEFAPRQELPSADVLRLQKSPTA